MDGGHLFKERECGHKRLLFFNAHRFREAKGWRVIRKGMPWLYAFHATGVVSLPHFNFLHSNFYLVLSHNHKCFGVVTQPLSGRNLPILWSGCIPVAALSAFLCRPKIHIKHGKQWQRASEDRRNGTRRDADDAACLRGRNRSTSLWRFSSSTLWGFYYLLP